MKSELCKRKVDTRDEFLAPNLGVTACTKETWKSTQANNATFTHVMQTALRLTVGFSHHLSWPVPNQSFLSNKLILYTYDVINHYCIFFLLNTSLRMAGEEAETCRRVTKSLYVTVSNVVQLLEYRPAWWLVWLHETWIIFNMQLKCYSNTSFLVFQRGFLPHFIILYITFDTYLIWQLPYVP